MTRQIILDTETTGINPLDGHKLIEIGCVEMIGRRFTGRTYHQYINPERVVEEEAIAVHGITNEYLEDKPVFSQVADEFCAFVEGAELVIHNAPFDVGFLNHELKLINSNWGLIEDHCTILDTLVLAKHKHPGQRNSLDALCRRYGIDNSHRELHGALLDSEILADVYLLMTGGQKGLDLSDGDGDDDNTGQERQLISPALQLPVLRAGGSDLAAHNDYLALLDKKSGGETLYRKLGA